MALLALLSLEVAATSSSKIRRTSSAPPLLPEDRRRARREFRRVLFRSVESVIIAADGAAGFVVLGGCCDFVVQNTAHKLRPSAAARGPLNRIAFGGGWPEIDFCHHLGISLRILRAK